MNLIMFLSDRCNMACDYCFLRLNVGGVTVLKLEDAERAARDHLRRGANGRAQFTMLGGEPFVHYPLLKSIVAFIHEESGGKAPVNVVTNGARACPEKMKELSDLGAGFTVSLDGKSSHHDRHRSLVAGPGSSLDESLKALESCDKRGMKVNMVVCEDTAGSLLSNVEFLRAQGFSRLSFHLNILQDWSDAGLEVLRKSLEGFSRYYRTLTAASPGALELTHLDSFAGASAEHAYDDLVLGADGRYYPCDAFFALPYSEIGRWAVGDASSGIDWEKREAFHDEARAFIHGRLERKRHYSCPRETYFHAMATGQDPAAAVRAFHRADNILGDALAGLAGRASGLR